VEVSNEHFERTGGSRGAHRMTKKTEGESKEEEKSPKKWEKGKR